MRCTNNKDRRYFSLDILNCMSSFKWGGPCLGRSPDSPPWGQVRNVFTLIPACQAGSIVGEASKHISEDHTTFSSYYPWDCDVMHYTILHGLLSYYSTHVDTFSPIKSAFPKEQPLHKSYLFWNPSLLLCNTSFERKVFMKPLSLIFGSLVILLKSTQHSPKSPFQ